jgi:hypothetical protein
VEEIAMKKPKTVAELLTVADVCIEASKAWDQLMSLTARGPRRRNGTTGKSTLLIRGTARIMDIVASSPPIRKRRGISDALMT